MPLIAISETIQESSQLRGTDPPPPQTLPTVGRGHPSTPSALTSNPRRLAPFLAHTLLDTFRPYTAKCHSIKVNL